MAASSRLRACLTFSPSCFRIYYWAILAEQTQEAKEGLQIFLFLGHVHHEFFERVLILDSELEFEVVVN
jgi:uncharacterized protein involved in tolerance to divalent cations